MVSLKQQIREKEVEIRTLKQKLDVSSSKCENLEKEIEQANIKLTKRNASAPHGSVGMEVSLRAEKLALEVCSPMLCEI